MRTPGLLLCSVALLASVAHAGSAPAWVEVRSPHFVVLSDTNEKTARKTAGQLERMRAVFRTMLPNAGGDAGLPITVLALKNKNSFQPLMPAAYQAKGQMQLAGLFLPTQDRNYILMRLDTETEHPFAIVYHEYTHFVVRKVEWLPLWLNEGLAQFYENTDILDKEVQLGQPSTESILFLRDNRLIPLPVLFAVDHNSPYYHDEQKGSIFYAESWALTHMLEVNDSMHKTQLIGQYAHLLAKGVDPVSAATQAFGDLAKLQAALQSYVNGRDYRLFKLPSTFTADDASFVANPIDANEVAAARADVLAHEGRDKDAAALIDEVLHADPKIALAYEVRGFMAYQQHNLAAARSDYAEAVKLDSKSYLAYFHFASLSLMSGSGDKPEVAAALKKCTQLEPSFAPAYDALAVYYLQRRENLEEAHKLTLQAVQLEPGEIRYRLNAAQVLAATDRMTDAVRVLETALTIAKNPGDRALVQSRLDELKSFGNAQAQQKSFSAGHSTTSSVQFGPDGQPITAAPAEQPLPTAAPNAARKTSTGTLHHVTCSYPSVVRFDVESKTGTITLFAPNMYKVTYSTVGYVATGDLDPCKAMEGMMATVHYAAVTDKTFAGEVSAIELTK